MSRLRLLALGLLAATCSCRERRAPLLRIELSAIPSASATLEARFTLGGRAALAPASFSAPAGGFHDVESFVVDLPFGATGALAVAVTAHDAPGCVTAGNEATIADVAAGRGLTLPLLTAGRAGCLLTVDVPDAAHGRVDFDGGGCPDGCTSLRPIGSTVTLAAIPSADGAFLAWQGDCGGDGDCAVGMDRPRHVSARFAARGLTFARGIGGVSNSEYASGVAFDEQGNVYVVGTFASALLVPSSDPLNPIPPIANAGSEGTADGFVVKLDQTGRVLWAKTLGGPFDDSLLGVATLGDDVYLAGTIGGAAIFDGSTRFAANINIVVLQLSSDGPLRASRLLQSNVPQQASKLLAAPDGSLFVAGVNMPTGRNDGLVYALRPDLTTAATLVFGGTLTDGSNDVGPSGFTLDQTGGVVVSGSYAGTVDFAGATRTSAGRLDGFALALTRGLGRRWVTTVGGTDLDSARGIAMVPTGGLVVGGEFGDTMQVGDRTLMSQGLRDAWVAKLDTADGTLSGAISFGTPNYDGVQAIAVEDNGAVALLGFTDLTTPGPVTDMFMAWLDPALQTVRYEPFNGRAEANTVSAIDVHRGNTVGVGAFLRVTNPGGQPLASIGFLDGFVVRWSAWP